MNTNTVITMLIAGISDIRARKYIRDKGRLYIIKKKEEFNSARTPNKH